MSARATESYGQHGVTWVDRFGVWLSQRAIRRWLPAGDRLKVIELGCGYRATQLVALRDRMEMGTGVDFSIAPELRARPGLMFHEGPIEATLPQLADGAYDVVLLISVLEHLRDPQAALDAAHRLLRPGGVLLVNVPTWRGKFFLEFSAFRLGLSPRVEMDDHKMYYDQRDLWPLLVRAGFRPSALRLSYHKFGLNLFAAATKSIDG
ncbi:MAG TPA: class I SAM-dependent methyltransferase [Lacunisphaera sp.]